MTKLLKYLKAYTGTVLIIVCVLFVQAFCDLSLPSYTSDIVNVGIQQGGIDTAVPKQIAKDDFDQLLLLISEKDHEFVTDSYREGKPSDLDYEKAFYILKDAVLQDEEKLDALSNAMGKAMLLAQGMESNEELKAQYEGVDLYEMLSMMPDEQRDQMVKEMEAQLKDMPETMIQQAATVYIADTYVRLGIDMDALQNGYILKTGGKMLLLALLGMIASVTVGLFASRTAAAMGRDLRRNVFTKVVGFSSAEFDKFSTASLITRSTNDIQQIQMMLVLLLRMVLYAPIMAIGGIIKVFQTNVDMLWIIGLGVGLIVAIVLLLFLIVMPRFKKLQKLVDRMNLVTREILTGLSVIRAFSTERYEEQRFDKANRDLMKTNLFVNRAMTFMMPGMMFIMNGITVLIVWNGAHGVENGQMQVGDMMAFIQYTMQIIMSFLMICMVSIMLPRAAVAAGRVDEVLTSKTLIHDPEEPKQLEERGKGLVTFDHVSFRYPGAEKDVLHDLTFTAKPGATTAIIGSTGSGKSTLVNLIPRFYDVTEGPLPLTV